MRCFAIKMKNGVPVEAYPDAYITKAEAEGAHPGCCIVRVNGGRERNEYKYGKSAALLNLKVDEELFEPYTTDGDYEGWKSIASRLKSVTEYSFNVLKRGEWIVIRRVA